MDKHIANIATAVHMNTELVSFFRHWENEIQYLWFLHNTQSEKWWHLIAVFAEIEYATIITNNSYNNQEPNLFVILSLHAGFVFSTERWLMLTLSFRFQHKLNIINVDWKTIHWTGDFNMFEITLICVWSLKIWFILILLLCYHQEYLFIDIVYELCSIIEFCVSYIIYTQ